MYSLSRRWYRIPTKYRLAALGSISLVLLGILNSLTFVGASPTTTISFTVTSGTGFLVNLVAIPEKHVPTGGGNRNISTILGSLTSDQLPQIVVDRHLPMRDGILRAAAKTSYADVPEGIWYKDAVDNFVRNDILDSTQLFFRGGDTAVRAEFAKILGKLNGGSAEVLPAILTFDDVPRSSWYAPFMELAARKKWMRGYRNCAGTHPCNVMPASTIPRAEAIAMAVRFYALKATGKAPRFADVSSDAWYKEELSIAADHCIVQPEGQPYLARPSDLLTRAEMVVLLYRAKHSLSYGKDCHWPGTPASSQYSAESSTAASSLASGIHLDSSSSSFFFLPTLPPSTASSSIPFSAASSSASSSSSNITHPAAPDLPAGTTIQSPTPPTQMALATIATMLLVGALGALALGRIFLR